MFNNNFYHKTICILCFKKNAQYNSPQKTISTIAKHPNTASIVILTLKLNLYIAILQLHRFNIYLQ